MLAGQGEDYMYTFENYANQTGENSIYAQNNTQSKHSSKFFDRVLQMTTSSEKPSNMVSKARRPKHKYRENDPEQFTQHPRPSLSYNELIIEAIQNSSEGMLSLQDIYDYIQDEYPFFKESKIAWQNSIRHNLSVQKMFVRAKRPPHFPGKGGLWRILPWAIVHQKPNKKRMPEEQDTCVNTPQLPSPTLELPAIKQNHLMDTLATLALSSESQPAPWDYAAFNPMYQIPSPFSMFTAQAAEQPQVQSQQTQQRYGILDPNVGDKTLLQATNFDDLNFPGSFE